MDEHNENLDKKCKEVQNRMYTKLKNIVKGFSSRLDKGEEWISELEDKTMELTQSSKIQEEF